MGLLFLLDEVSAEMCPISRKALKSPDQIRQSACESVIWGTINMTSAKTTLLAGVLGLAATAPSAAVTSYSNLGDWTAATHGMILLEDLNGFVEDDVAPFDAGDFMVAAVGDFAMDNGIEAYDPNPNDIQRLNQDRNIDGTTYYSADVARTVITFVFDFAINSISWDQRSTQSEVNITFDGFTQNLGDGAFFGLTSTEGVTSFTLSGRDGAFGLDNFRYTAVAAVPVPAALPLLLAGLGGLGMVARRRKAA